jgi:hypothetical protein
VQNNSRSRTTQPNRSTLAPSSKTASSQNRTTASPNGRTAPANLTVRNSASQTEQATAGTCPTMVVVCRKCRSPQIAASKRGYSFASLFKCLGWMFLLPVLILLGSTIITGFVLVNGSTSIMSESLTTIIYVLCGISMFFSLPVSVLTGLIGRSQLVNNCMNCGHKWMPAKKK